MKKKELKTFGFSTRIGHAFENAEINSLEDLLKRSAYGHYFDDPKPLIYVNWLGKKAVEEIKGILKSSGYSLQPDKFVKKNKWEFQCKHCSKWMRHGELKKRSIE